MKNSLVVSALLATSLNAFALEAPRGFKQEQVTVNGVKLNVYKGGHGDPLLLIHGFAQSSLMWAPVMEALKDKYTIIAPDLRGAGESEVSKDGYDKVNMAGDMKALLAHYGYNHARVVGHDVGLMVAYALAAKYPTTVEKLVLLDAFLPGIGAGDAIYNSPDIWHFRVNGPFAEELVKGREKLYLDALWTNFSADPKTFPDAEKDYFARQYAQPGHMRAGFAWFKAFPRDAADNRELVKTKLKMPVLTIGGEKAMGQPLGDSTRLAAEHVTVKVLPNVGHWLMEEAPREVITSLKEFL